MGKASRRKRAKKKGSHGHGPRHPVPPLCLACDGAVLVPSHLGLVVTELAPAVSALRWEHLASFGHVWCMEWVLQVMAAEVLSVEPVGQQVALDLVAPSLRPGPDAPEGPVMVFRYLLSSVQDASTADLRYESGECPHLSTSQVARAESPSGGNP